MKYILAFFILITCLGFSKFSKDKKETHEQITDKTIYDFTLNDINGDKYDLKDLSGKVILIVNVASRCGFTNQYIGLEKLYNQYKKDDFLVIGIPSNDFGNQEPGTEKSIKEFCETKYKISFPMMAKVHAKGKDINDLFKFLTDKEIHPITGGPITWNFNKFLINKEGLVVDRFSSYTKPLSNKITNKIERLIKGEKNEN